MSDARSPEDVLVTLRTNIEALQARFDDVEPELERLRGATLAAQKLAADELTRRLASEREVARLQKALARVRNLRTLRYTRHLRLMYGALRREAQR